MIIAIYVLYRRNEFDKAACFLERVAKELSSTVRLYLLINDEDCFEIRNLASILSKNIIIICAGENIGVAGGRNLLIRSAISDGAEILISCDSDIIFEAGYFAKISSDYNKIKEIDQRIGLVQPVLLNGPDVKECFRVLKNAESWGALRGQLGNDSELNRPFWALLEERLGVKRTLSAVMHTGITNVWEAHFGESISKSSLDSSERDPVLKWLPSKRLALHHDSSLLNRLIQEGKPVRIATTAGGISVFHKSVYECCGEYNNIFNPFGYEDSEFGFRVSLNGFNNYLIVTNVAIHDIFVTGQNRSLMYAPRIGLLRGVEAGLDLVKSHRNFMVRQSVFAGFRALVNTFARRSGELNDPVLDFSSALISYYFEFARGVFHSILNSEKYEKGVMDLLGSLLQAGSSDFSCLSFPLDDNVCFVFDRLVKKGGLVGDLSQSMSLLAYNCRIQEKDPLGGIFESRYFDCAVRVNKIEKQCCYLLDADILSNDIYISCEAELFIDPYAAPKNGFVKVNRLKINVKEHDYGKFSVEELYPRPNLHSSKGWVPMVVAQLQAIRDISPNIGHIKIADAIEQYLMAGHGKQGNDLASYNFDSLSCHGNSKAVEILSERKKRILIFTDSRGQHKPKGCFHKTFAERLAEDSKYEVDAYICPMKWTTTLDFLSMFSTEVLATYDHVVLYTGIVDWSPRKYSNALNDLYDPVDVKNTDNATLNTENYAKKVVNNKKAIFDQVFGEIEMRRHFSSPFGSTFEGQDTINMYRLSAARESLIPLLLAIPNIIFINANRFVHGWSGDFPRTRPENISIIHDYSSAFAELFPGHRLINLMTWSDAEVKLYTCDNLHLTEEGSDYIYQELLKKIGGDIPPIGRLAGVSNLRGIENSAVIDHCLTLQKNSGDSSSIQQLLLRTLSTFLLLDPRRAINRLASDSELRRMEEAALRALSSTSLLKSHYRQVRERAKNFL